jgi:hypothetical protein
VLESSYHIVSLDLDDRKHPASEAQQMLTSYMVKCPRQECGWFGSALPRSNADSWHGAVPTVNETRFQCPRCRHEWRARVRGDEVEPLPVNQEPFEALA